MAGDPGIIMIVDTHPGSHAVDVPLVQEDLKNVLLTVEGRIPSDVHLYQLRIYVRSIFLLWSQIEFTILGRQFQVKIPDFSQPDLAQVWDNHETRAGRG